MEYRTINMENGEERELNLASEAVIAVGSGVIGYFHADGETATVYKRVIERDRGPSHAAITVPDSAVIVATDASTVDYLVEV